MTGTSKVIVLDPDARSGRQLRLGFEREGVPTAALDANRPEIKEAPDLVVVLTDLDGPARFRPRWPVLWAVPESHAAAEPPFGRKLVLTFA